MPRHIVCLTYDFDVQSGFISRGMTSPTPLSRGEFGVVGSKRILDLVKAHSIPTTWFVPGFTIETYPAACEAVVKGGHEIGHHSWAHTPPASQTLEEEEADMLRASAAIKQLTGGRAVGYRSPSWDLSENTLNLLLKYGFEYDSSMMGDDYTPYRVRNGDIIALDAAARSLVLEVAAEEIARRLAEVPPPSDDGLRGYARLYRQTILQADQGCDFDFCLPPVTAHL